MKFQGIVNRFISRYIIYTKVLQWINFDFLSFLGTGFNDFLKKFTDNAPYVEEDIDHNSLDRLNELGSKYLIEIDRNPINSGTISLVFTGTIFHNSEYKKVAIKVLRNGIHSKINDCIINFTWIFSYMKYIPVISGFNLDILFSDVKESLYEQTDFAKEANNILMFEKRLSKHKNIKPIKLIKELTFDNVIVMEFVEGKSVFKLNDEDKKIFSTKITSSLFYLKFKKCLFHLDLHPGNILMTNDKKITFLDLGMVLELSVDECNFIIDFLDLFKTNNNVEEILTRLFNTYSYLVFREKVSKENFIKDIINSKPDIFVKKDNVSFVSDTKFLLYQLNELDCKLSKRINKIIFGIISFINIFINLGEDMYSIIAKNSEIYNK